MTAPRVLSGIAHLAGRCITAQGRYRRQRCEWCGYALIEDDLALMMVAPGSARTEPGQWAPGEWVEVAGANPTSYRSLGDLDKMPENSCMCLETGEPEMNCEEDGG